MSEDGKVPAEEAERLLALVVSGEITVDEMEVELEAYPAYRAHQERVASVELRKAQEADAQAELALRDFVESLGAESWPLANNSEQAVAFVRCGGPCGSRRVGVIVRSQAGLLLVEDRGKGHAPPELVDVEPHPRVGRPRPQCEKCGEVDWPPRPVIRHYLEVGLALLTTHAPLGDEQGV